MVQRSRRRRSSTRRRNTRRKQRSTRRKQRSTRRKQRSTRRKQRLTRRRRNTRRRRKIKSKRSRRGQMDRKRKSEADGGQNKSKKYDLRSTGKRSRDDAGDDAGDAPAPPLPGVVWAGRAPEPVPGGRFAALMMAGISKKKDPLVPKIYTTMVEMDLATPDSKYEKQIVFKSYYEEDGSGSVDQIQHVDEKNSHGERAIFCVPLDKGNTPEWGEVREMPMVIFKTLPSKEELVNPTGKLRTVSFNVFGIEGQRFYKYEDPRWNWGELSPVQKKAAEYLGGTERDWPPKRGLRDWRKLNQEQKEAVNALLPKVGGTKEEWPPPDETGIKSIETREEFNDMSNPKSFSDSSKKEPIGQHITCNRFQIPFQLQVPDGCFIVFRRDLIHAGGSYNPILFRQLWPEQQENSEDWGGLKESHLRLHFIKLADKNSEGIKNHWSLMGLTDSTFVPRETLLEVEEDEKIAEEPFRVHLGAHRAATWSDVGYEGDNNPITLNCYTDNHREKLMMMEATSEGFPAPAIKRLDYEQLRKVFKREAIGYIERIARFSEQGSGQGVVEFSKGIIEKNGYVDLTLGGGPPCYTNFNQNETIEASILHHGFCIIDHDSLVTDPNDIQALQDMFVFNTVPIEKGDGTLDSRSWTHLVAPIESTKKINQEKRELARRSVDPSISYHGEKSDANYVGSDGIDNSTTTVRIYLNEST